LSEGARRVERRRKCLLERKAKSAVADRQKRGLAGSSLFPQGYEGRLRAFGLELDMLGGISQVSLIETGGGLYVDYDRIGDDIPTGITHQHLLLSSANLDAMLAAAEARRRTFPLSDMIRKAQDT
jgi:hypothetical protein